MGEFEIFVLVVFVMSIIGGFLATSKLNRFYEDVGQSLFLTCIFATILTACWPGVSLTWYERAGPLILAIIVGFLLGVLLWRDRRPRAKHPATNPKLGTLE